MKPEDVFSRLVSAGDNVRRIRDEHLRSNLIAAREALGELLIKIDLLEATLREEREEDWHA